MTVVISGDGLELAQVAAVGRGAEVQLSDAPDVLDRIERSRAVIRRAVAGGQQIYGITTLFGGMADVQVGADSLVALQELALWQHKSTTGPRLPKADVRAAMLLRANSLMKGVSGVRLALIERYVTFLNADATPQVYQRGSIGASGDLVPLSYIAGALIGLAPDFLVDFAGETVDSHTALERLGLRPLKLLPKEGLAMNNGTGACTGIAANVTARALELMPLSLGLHALIAQAMRATSQSFVAFIHRLKPHPGQLWVAAQMQGLLAGSRLIRDESAGRRDHRDDELMQDRYSLRCLPQFLGPVYDALTLVARQITVEANCANDNPLIDPDTGEVYHTGNFLAQYTGVAMDQLRHHVGLAAKHIDTQLALLMAPEFSHGLSASLVGNTATNLNVGLKSLQIVGNAMMPLMSFYGQPMVDRFPTHAEQFNQNINSQAMNAANLARDTMDVYAHYLALALICATQAVELRSHQIIGTYDPRALLSPRTVPLYEAVQRAAGGKPDAHRPMLWNDLDAFIQPKVEGVLAQIVGRGSVIGAVGELIDALQDFSSGTTML